MVSTVKCLGCGGDGYGARDSWYSRYKKDKAAASENTKRHNELVRLRRRALKKLTKEERNALDYD